MRNDMEINIKDIIFKLKKYFCKVVEKREVAILLVEIGIIISYALLCNITHYYQEKNASFFGFDSKDYYTAEGIKIWDEYGCSIFFEDKQEEVQENLESIISDSKIIENIQTDTKILLVFNRYSKVEIESAINAIVYGCKNSKHSSGKYNSIKEVPEPLLRSTYYEIISHTYDSELYKGVKAYLDRYISNLEQDALNPDFME
jgi:hypothetical protein